jgi:hypothetical protein
MAAALKTSIGEFSPWEVVPEEKRVEVFVAHLEEEPAARLKRFQAYGREVVAEFLLINYAAILTCSYSLQSIVEKA